MATPYLGNDKFSTSLTSQWNFSPADTTMSVGAVPPNVPTIVTAGFDTADETVFSVTGTSGGNTLTGVTRLRGANKDLPQGTTIEVLNNMEFWNQYASAIFTQSGLKSLLYGVDGNANDSYAITLLVAPASYSDITGVPIVFKANTINTGAATLNVNTLGAKTIKKFGDTDLSDGDIAAGQVVTVVYDGTNFQFQSETASVSIDTDGTLAANSDTVVPSQKAVKTYVDTQVAASTTPSFHANRNAVNQAITGSTATKVAYNNEVFDTNTNYDPTTNYRFTPTVAGKYLIHHQVSLTTEIGTAYLYAYIYKNGAAVAQDECRGGGNAYAKVTTILDMNGSSDYVEGWTWTSATPTISGSAATSYFTGCKIG